MSAVWNELVGEQLRTKGGNKATADVLAGKKVIGLYFSAHWCPPCRGFTPVLSETYEEVVEAHPEFELIFVSADQGVEAFEEYFGEMPFTAVPFENRAQEEALSRKFDVTGIPTLIFLNDKGEVITADGRSVVAKANGDVESIWAELSK